MYFQNKGVVGWDGVILSILTAFTWKVENSFCHTSHIAQSLSSLLLLIDYFVSALPDN